jgi:ankyrin repeat protein
MGAILGLLSGCASGPKAPTPEELEHLNQQFVRAAREGDLVGCSELLLHGANLEAKLQQDGTLLAGYLPRVGSTALHVAIVQKNQELENWLLKHGADPDARDGGGFTPLEVYFQTPIALGPEDLAVALIEHKAKVDTHARAAGDVAGATPLHLAAQLDLARTTTALLDHHADVNGRAENGATPLHWSLTDSMIRRLVGAGGDLEAVDKKGRTPLVFRVSVGDFGTAVTLLNAGAKASPVLPDELSGTTLFHLVIGHVDLEKRRAPALALLQALIRRGADVNARDAADQTPLFYACSLSGDAAEELALFLLKNGADPGLKDLRGQTPLHAACLRDHARLVRALIAKGADVHAKDESELTPLHQACAAHTGDTSVLQALVKAGADLHARDSEGREPLDFVRPELREKAALALFGD